MPIEWKKVASLILLCVCLCAASAGADEDQLQIVFMFGQSEMVGHADISTASYMLRKPPVIPRDVAINAHKGMLHQINGAYLYWQAMNSYGGPKEKKEQLQALIVERAEAKAEFKQHVLAELEKNDGMFRGKKYSKRRGAYRGFWLFNMCDEEVEKTGLTVKIRALLDAPDNKFNVENAYDQMVRDSEARYAKQQELNKLLLSNTTSDDFAKYREAVKEYEVAAQEETPSPEDKRGAYAALAEKHLHMPIARRTRIAAMGEVVGTPAPAADAGKVTHGKLCIGYGSSVNTIGLEYAAGITLERMIDAPILVVKCAWNTGPGAAMQKGDTADPSWEHVLAYVKGILADPGKYHPEYDPKAGYRSAGMIWFQGLSDRENSEYGLQLATTLKDFRKFVKNPAMPVVCATVGTMFFQGESDDSLVNRGMKDVASMSDFKGSMAVVETYRFYPVELAAAGSLFHKRKLNPGSPEGKLFQSAIQEATGRRLPYLGSASFQLLAGNEVGTRLGLMIKSKK